MIAEVSLSLVLRAGAGVMMRTFVAERAVTRGFDERNLVTIWTCRSPTRPSTKRPSQSKMNRPH